jgi:hypothetical protein
MMFARLVNAKKNAKLGKHERPRKKYSGYEIDRNSLNKNDFLNQRRYSYSCVFHISYR